MTAAAADRMAKFDRVLPRLRLEHAVYLRRQPIVVLAEGLEDRCDVLAQLVDGEGRIHAEQVAHLAPGNGAIALGQALNQPAGRYEVVLTPPRAEFHATTPAERRIPVTLASEAVTDTPAADAQALGSSLIETLATGAGPVAALARLAKGAPRQRDDAALARAVTDPAMVFALLALDTGAAPLATAQATAALSVLAGRPGIEGVIAAELCNPSDATAGRLRTAGIAGGGDLLAPEAVAALVALAARRPGLSGLAEALIDRAALGLALSSDRGSLAAPTDGPADSRVSRHAALGMILFGVGTAGGAGPEAVALAAAGYDCPALIRALAFDGTERHWSEGGRTVWRGDGVVLSACEGHWQVRIGADVIAAGQGTASVGPGLVTAEGSAPSLGLHAAETVVVRPDRIVLRAGDRLFGLRSDADFALGPDPSGAGRCLSGGGGRWTLRLGTGDPDRFADGLDHADAPPQAPPPDCIVTRPGGIVELRFGDHALQLDFSEDTR
ncbi:hypothetical protein HKCCE2091_04615 [Rhodobacterales bacterium HKCCE2091]|nr:hypothetical protein [Rhodobacterales bacterium HKCCE2091]